MTTYTIYQLAADEAAYGIDSGRFIVTGADHEREYSGPMAREDATAFAAALTACSMVVDRWERGDLAEAARACAAVVAEAEGTAPSAPGGAPKKRFSVLLLYPEDVNDGGSETYYAWVEAPGPAAAVAEARRRALAANEWADRDPADFVPLLVTEGHHHGQPLSLD